MIIARKEYTLARTSDFEWWAAILGVRIKKYHADNEIFSWQYFRSAIEDSNHTIACCKVGSYHQDSIFERKIQTLTLGARTLIINVKIFCPEAITIML